MTHKAVAGQSPGSDLKGERNLSCSVQEQHDRAVAADQSWQDRFARLEVDRDSARERAANAAASMQQMEASLAELQAENATLMQASEDHKLAASEHGIQYEQFSKQLQEAADALTVKDAAVEAAQAAADGAEQRHRAEMLTLQQELADVKQANAVQSQGTAEALDKVQQDLSEARAEAAAAAAAQQLNHEQQKQQEKQAVASAQETNMQLQALQQELNAQLEAAQRDVYAARAEAAAAAGKQNELEQQLQQHQPREVTTAADDIAAATGPAMSVTELQSQLKVERAKAEATAFGRERLKSQLQEAQEENADLREAVEKLQQELQLAASAAVNATNNLTAKATEAKGMQALPMANGGSNHIASTTASARPSARSSADISHQEGDMAPLQGAAFVTLADGSRLDQAAAQQMQTDLLASTSSQQSLTQELDSVMQELQALQSVNHITSRIQSVPASTEYPPDVRPSGAQALSLDSSISISADHSASHLDR